MSQQISNAKQLKLSLIVMSFLEFAVWGAWLISLGAYLGGPLGYDGGQIGSFFATMGIASIFMPTLMGIVADRWIPRERLTSICHFIAGTLMMVAAGETDYATLYTLILLSVCFYMPTLGLTNSIAYGRLTAAGMDTVKHFPPIRVFGTVGFIVAMLVVDNLGLKNSPIQLYISGGISYALALFLFWFPASPVSRAAQHKQESWVDRLGLRAFMLFKERRMAIFFVFSMLLGICLQITNSFANDYLTNHFGRMDEYKGAFGVTHSGTLISLSQISEAVCILFIPFFLKRYGIKAVMVISFVAWVLRFALLGAGDPGAGVWMLVLSMLVYGVAFDFFNISGSLYVDQQTDPALRSSAQGVFMMMTNGLGALVGSYLAGYVVKAYGYPDAWYVFAGYALVVTILFALFFRTHAPKPQS